MKRLLPGIVALAALAFGGPAIAADVPLKAPPMVAPVPSSWTGFYVGGQLGAKWTKDDWTTTCVDDGPGQPCGSANNAAAHPIDLTSPNRFSTTSFRGGGYAGANWQILPTWLVGVEGDVAWSNSSSSIVGIPGCSAAPLNTCGIVAGGAPFSSTAGDSTLVKNGYDASVRGRLGFLVTPDWLVYGTGGVAFQQIDATVACNPNTSPLCFTGFAVESATQSTTLMGWTAGGGLEWKFWNNWLLRGEYRYSSFGTWRPVFVLSPADIVHVSVKVNTQVATFGISYLFPAK